MVDNPILRFPNPTAATRRTGAPRNRPSSRGPGRAAQGGRFQGTFDRLATAMAGNTPEVTLRADPAGIAPERALVFITAGSISGFARAARDIGLELFAEAELEDTEDFPSGFVPPDGHVAISRTLYATMPTLEVFRRILTLWNAHQNGQSAPNGAAPWWQVFDLLIELRPWGPEDRLPQSSRTVIQGRLPSDDNEAVAIEIEIWPAPNSSTRAVWRQEARERIVTLGGRAVHESSIIENGFIYEAILAFLPARAVRQMLDNPAGINGLATLEGVQLILPQTIGQALPSDDEGRPVDQQSSGLFDTTAPFRAALLDGTPIAAHSALNGGVEIADINDIVRLSSVDQRLHATAMASLILRGDLIDDGAPLRNARLISVPVLIDAVNASPQDRLFVDLVHTALTALLLGPEPLAADIFVVNFSIGVIDTRFAGRVSALARLLDWWSARHGILFVISAGNIAEPLHVEGVTAMAFEAANEDERYQHFRAAMRAATFDRTLLAPAEAINGLTVGAVSKDFGTIVSAPMAGILSLSGESAPQMTSALGLGFNRGIKPDILQIGGHQEVRVLPNGDNSFLQPVRAAQRTGLVVAGPGNGGRGTHRSRGTSTAAAMTTRALLQAANALIEEDGPYEGQNLSRRALALLSRALAINSARWPSEADKVYDEIINLHGRYQYKRAKEEVCRYYGYGVLVPELMQRSPDQGVTMVGLDTIRKDQAKIFKFPLPPSMAGERVPRSMRATLAWFSPVNPARAQYRLAGLEAVVAENMEDVEDKSWRLGMAAAGPDANMARRGTAWSRHLTHNRQTVPAYEADAEIPICVQCRDTAAGGLSPDEDIMFAIAVSLQVEAEVDYDIYDEVKERIQLRVRGNG